jgi:transcriptional regulator with XRE-family HTH domain
MKMAQFIKNKQVQDEFKRALEIIDKDWSLNLERQLLDVRERISQQMDKRNMTRADLAKTLNSSRAYVTQLLSGKENIRLSTLFKVSFALGLKPVIQFQDEDDELLESFFRSRVHQEPTRQLSKSETVTVHEMFLKGEYERT